MIGARAVALAAALSAASCGAPLMKLPSGSGVPAADAEALVSQVTGVCGRISTISAEVGVSGSIGGRRVRGRLLTGLAAPASLYIEAPAPFGAPVFVLGASGDEATLVLPRDRRVLEHGRTEDVFEALTGVPLSAAELKATLTGCVAGPRANQTGATSFGPDWRVIHGDRTLYLRRERTSVPWRLVSIVRDGANGWRVDYQSFLNDLPRSVRLISTEPRRFDLRLELSQVEINVDLQPDIFRVRIPAGSQPITIDELRATGPLAR